MKEQEELGFDGLRNEHSEKGSPARRYTSGKGCGDMSVMTVKFGCPGRVVARTRLSLFVSLLLALVLALVMLAAPVASPAQVSVGVSVTFGPPPLPVYAQPLCPGPGFVWIPGYWAWDPAFGYYWVPGMWVLAPFVGALWTPGYWAWNNGVYIWYEGYWGPTVGFYGGINYGYGYTGYGYDGGYWSGGRFYYNRKVNNINVTNITTVYSRTASNVRPTGTSFNGGPGGTTVRPTSEQQIATRQRHSSLTDAQKHQMRVARTNPEQRATVNRGRPAVAATANPGEFTGRGVTGAGRAGAPYRAQPGHKAAPEERVRTPRPGPQMHPPFTGSEHITPGTPRKEPERRMNEPRPAPRPETNKPSPKEERTKGEREEQR